MKILIVHECSDLSVKVNGSDKGLPLLNKFSE